MSKEKSKSKLIVWALVALVIGIVLGLFITTAVATGKAKSVISEKKLNESPTPINLDIDLDVDFELKQYEQDGQITGEFQSYLEEDVFSNIPAKFVKNETVHSYIPSYLGNFISNTDTVYLEEINGGYNYISNTFYSFIYPEFNPRLDYTVDGTWFYNGIEEYVAESITANEYNYPFANVTQFTYNCDGQYQMSHTDVGGVNYVYFYLYIADENYNNYWTYSWDMNPLRTDNYYGYFPTEATAILNNGNNYNVSFGAIIHTNQENKTHINSWKNINCVNGKSDSIAKTEIRELDKKLDLTDIKK